MKFVIYVEDKFKSQVQKYIKEIYNEDNISVDNIEETQTDDDTEYEAEKFAKKQKLMQKILIGIVTVMVLSVIIVGMFAR